MKNLRTWAAAAVMAACGTAQLPAQILVHQESFETDGSGSIRYLVMPGPAGFYHSRSAYFLWSAGKSNGVLTPFFGADGHHYIAGENLGADPDQDVGGVGTIKLNPVDISGYHDLALEIALAAKKEDTYENAAYPVPSGQDYLRIEYAVDYGDWQVLAQFAGDRSSGQRGYLRQDTDLNMVGDGPVVLDRNFQNFRFAIPAKGERLQVRVLMASSATTEEMALDNLRITGDKPLPTQLLTFAAQPRTTGIELNWTMRAEQNNALFTVERSVDGQTYRPVKTVPGAGNIKQPTDYAAMDPNPPAGVVFYRLKQTDYDGSYSYLDVQAVQPTQASEVGQIEYAALSDKKLHLALENAGQGPALLRVIAPDGRTVHQETVELQNSLDRALPNVNGGPYLLQLQTERGTLSRRIAAD